MDCSHQVALSMGILQARILQWAAMTSSRDLPNPEIKPSQPRDVSSTSGQVLYHQYHLEFMYNKRSHITARMTHTAMQPNKEIKKWHLLPSPWRWARFSKLFIMKSMAEVIMWHLHCSFLHAFSWITHLQSSQMACLVNPQAVLCKCPIVNSQHGTDASCQQPCE